MHTKEAAVAGIKNCPQICTINEWKAISGERELFWNSFLPMLLQPSPIAHNRKTHYLPAIYICSRASIFAQSLFRLDGSPKIAYRMFRNSERNQIHFKSKSKFNEPNGLMAGTGVRCTHAFRHRHQEHELCVHRAIHRSFGKQFVNAKNAFSFSECLWFVCMSHPFFRCRCISPITIQCAWPEKIPADAHPLGGWRNNCPKTIRPISSRHQITHMALGSYPVIESQPHTHI